MASSITQLIGFGQSPWYDNLTRALATGGLRQLVDEHGIRGVTSNPTIFEKAMASGNDYETWEGHDGFVSVEVSPDLAHDTEGTIAQAKQLWARIDRPNVMIKIPATEAGIPAIARALDAGLNVNVTLIFSLTRYDEVAHAFLDGLERRADRHGRRALIVAAHAASTS